MNVWMHAYEGSDKVKVCVSYSFLKNNVLVISFKRMKTKSNKTFKQPCCNFRQLNRCSAAYGDNLVKP